jgi:hypothetical protein
MVLPVNFVNVFAGNSMNNCRYSAVYGSCFMLNFHINSIKVEVDHVVVSGGGDGDDMKYKAKWLILASDFGGYVDVLPDPSRYVNRAIIISDHKICDDLDSIVISPPTDSGNGIYCKHTAHQSYCPTSTCNNTDDIRFIFYGNRFCFCRYDRFEKFL